MLRWQDYSIDPNSKVSLAYRREALQKAWRPPIVDRTQYLVNLANGKRVLDIGVVDHFVGDTLSGKWLHHHIAQSASYCLGIDILAEQIAKLKEKQYNVAVCDIMKDQLSERFDVIIAGEVIEHLGSAQQLVSFAYQHLTRGGRFAFTSPNPFFLTRFVKYLLNRGGESVDHVGFVFPSGVAELASRQNMILQSYRGIRLPPKWRGKLLIKFLDWKGWSQDVLCESFVYECIMPDEDEGL